MPETTYVDFTQAIDDATKEKLIAFFAEEKTKSKIMWARNKEHFFGNGDCIVFDQNIFQRDRKEKKPENTNTLIPGVCYEIISNEPAISRSHYKRISRIEFTMHLNENSVEFKKHGHGRVVKIQRYDRPESSIKTPTNDLHLQRILNKLHIKKPLIENNNSYTVMDFASGINLSQILEEDASGENTLTSEERVSLSIALLKALYAQPTSNEIIHNNLCPSNIIVDLTTAPIDVTIINYKKASLATKSPEKKSGALHFVAPEIVEKQVATFKADVFSLGRILALLWHVDAEKLYGGDMHGTTCDEDLRILSAKWTSEYRLSGLFSDITDLTDELQQDIRAVLSGMLKTSPDNRISIQQAIEYFPQTAPNVNEKITINFNNTLEDDTAARLHNFINEQSQHGIRVWNKNTLYIVNNDIGFIFTNSIVARKRKDDREGLRYEVISNNKKLGSGGFGDVFSIDFTMKFVEKSIIKKHSETNSNVRVVKTQIHHEKNPVHKVQKEYALAKKVGQLHIKPPVLSPDEKNSYTIMDKAPGCPLSKIIKADYNETHILSIQQRYDLSWQLLISLNEHVTQKGIIHRDIKPANICASLDEPIKIMFIDYGLSRLESEPDKARSGTRKFIAPEAANRSTSYKADVYSIARVLALIWRIDGNVHDNAEYSIGKDELDSLFTGIDDLGEQQKIDIRGALCKMLESIPENRCSIEEAIDIFPKFEDKKISEKTGELKLELSSYDPQFFHPKEQKTVRNQESFSMENTAYTAQQRGLGV